MLKAENSKDKVILVIVIFLLLIGATFSFLQTGLWNRLLFDIFQVQHFFNQKLVSAIQAARQDGFAATWSIIGISLVYGVFHAAGPGHGKAVIATYLGTGSASLKRGIFLSIASSLAQGLSALFIVGIASWLFAQSIRTAMDTAVHVEAISFASITLLGIFLTARSALGIFRWWRQRRDSLHAAHIDADTHNTGHGPNCGCCHGPPRQAIQRPLSWRTTLPIILAIGLRPCTGAILVLLASTALGVPSAGVIAVLTMSLGTATTVSAIAVATVTGRDQLIRWLPSSASNNRLSHLLALLVGTGGGLLIVTLGLSLLIHNTGTAAAPPLL